MRKRIAAAAAQVCRTVGGSVRGLGRFLGTAAGAWTVVVLLLMIGTGIINRLHQRTGYAPSHLAVAPVAKVDAADAQQWGYAAGATIGQNVSALLETGVPNVEAMDRAAFLRGLEDAITGRAAWMSKEQVEEVLAGQQAIEQERQRMEAAANKAAGEAFMKEYATREGVTALPGGTLYRTVTAGTGPVVGTATAMVHYTGTLPDGTEFDSSRTHGDEPVPLSADFVVPGFGEALAKMHVGDTWEIVIPGDQGYGPAGAPGSPIGPDQTLVFTVEVVKLAD